MTRWLGLFAALSLSGCATIASPNPAPARWWMTTGDRSQLLTEQAPVPAIAAPAAGTTVIRIDPAQRYQSMVGFGASITDASADLIQGLPADKRQALLAELFGRANGGLGFSFTRLTVGASDFSSVHYSYDDTPGNVPDPQLRHFSIAPARRAMLPTARAALAINPDLKVMISPWSAPAWMKTSKSLIKGRLDPAHYDSFARYFARTIEAFQADGVPVYALSIQNEPDFEPENYPGMRMSPAERAAVIGGHLGPLLAQRGIKAKILEWDHNWDKPEQPLGTLADPVANRYIAGVAWHCYAGDVAVQAKVHDAYPDKDAFFTECSGGEWAPRFDETLGWMTDNLIIGATRGWARGSLVWNLALDPRFGPHLGGCGDCRGVVTIDPAGGAITRNVEYYALGHASRFVLPGAVRIGSDSGVDGVNSVAFLNPGQREIAVIAHNGGKAARAVAFTVAAKNYPVQIPAGAVVTLTFPAPTR